MLGTVATSGCVAKRLDTMRIVKTKDRLHEMCQRMIVEVGGYISHFKAPVRRRWGLVYSRRQPGDPQSRTRDAQAIPLGDKPNLFR
jgi:hypothetical protein